jgi:transposase
MNEKEIREEIRRMLRENPSLKAIDIANRFGMSESWAYRRLNPRYAPKKARKAAQKPKSGQKSKAENQHFNKVCTKSAIYREVVV